MKPASIWDWLGPFALMAAFLCYLSLHSGDRIDFCGEQPNCFREWFGALSGWIAAIGALLAAYFTIKPMREQVREAKRQADFQLGDAEPSIDAVQHRRTGSLVILHIVNWNRRGFILKDVTASDGLHIVVRSAELDGEPEETPADDEFLNFPIAGWIHRTEAPKLFKLRFTFADAHGERAGDWGNIVLQVRYELVGERVAKIVPVPIHMTSAKSALG